MRALFLIPGDELSQIRVLPAAAAVAKTLGFSLQVACSPAAAPIWKLLPAVEKVIGFDFADASLADWANLMGSVREPDFQVCINLAAGRQVDLMLSMSHIPTRIAERGFSATCSVQIPRDGWPCQQLEAVLKPIGVPLQAEAFRLSLPAAALKDAQAQLPSGDGPVLLLAPALVPGDWPEANWRELPERIRASLPSLRCLTLPQPAAASVVKRAALVAASDVVLASDPLTEELALLCGVPLVALGRDDDSLPRRDGVKGLTDRDGLGALSSDAVMAALGLA
jgi:ADP-heptose:LPS heptosyltransferase